MAQALRRIARDDSGQGLLEYGIILTLVGAACVAALTGIGSEVKAIISSVASDL